MFVEQINAQSLGSPRFVRILLTLEYTDIKTLVERGKKSSKMKKI